MQDAPPKQELTGNGSALSLSQRAMLVAMGTELTALARLLVWSLVESGVDHRWVEYKGRKAFARLMGIKNRQTQWRPERELAQHGLAEFEYSDITRVRLTIPTRIDENLLVNGMCLFDGTEPVDGIPKASPPMSRPKRKNPEKTVRKTGRTKKTSVDKKRDRRELKPDLDPASPPVGDAPKQQSRGLTQDQINWITGSAENFAAYWNHGQREPTGDQQPPFTRDSWRRHVLPGPPMNVQAELWSIGAFAGFYWYRVCRYREACGIPLQIPTNVGRLMRTIKEQLKNGGPALFELIIHLTDFFDIVKFMFGRGGYGNSLTLNEATIDRVEVRGVVQQVQMMTNEQRAQIMLQIQEERQAASEE